MAAAVMREAGGLIQEHYRLGALSTSLTFYERLGWLQWRGPTRCREGGDLTRTPDEDGGVRVLPTPSSPCIDLVSDIAAEWRPGDVC